MQTVHPMENAFTYKNLLFLINNQSLRNEQIMSYLNTTFQYIPVDNSSQTVVVNGNELYNLSITDNIFTFYSIDGKYIEQTIPLLHSLIESIVLMIKTKYSSESLANFVSVKLCCYFPIDKKIPFGFVKHSDNNTTDLFGNPLLQNLTLYTKMFEFNDQYELKTLSFEHLVDYTDMIRKFVQPVPPTPPSSPNISSMSVVAPQFPNMYKAQPFFKKF